MKRIYSRIPYILSILSLTVICQLLSVNSLQAQVQSAAFDPNCYQPAIGTPGVVDTIYGSYNGQALGSTIKNLGLEKEESYSTIIIGSGNGIPFIPYPEYKSGPNFDLHTLHAFDTLNLSSLINPKNLIKKGHFRSRQYSDALFNTPGYPPRIYWEDDNGKYDSTRYTELKSQKVGSRGVNYDELEISFVTYLTSDSVFDVVYGFPLDYGPGSIPFDSTYFLLFIGGEHLYQQGKTAFADSLILFDTTVNGRFCSQGDYRGSGREDLIGNYNGDAFFYKNDPPFSMKKLVDAMRYDTLMASWQNPNRGSRFNANQFSMRAFTKQPGDSSVDFMPINDYMGQIQFYRGGSDFGSQRLFENHTDFIIHHPVVYDSKWAGLNFPGDMEDCGHLANTRNRVLHIGGFMDGGFYGYEFFYVLGDVMDDKADMFFASDNHGGAFVGTIDTLMADGKNKQDILLGSPEYGENSGNDEVGTIWLIHGSNNIPDITRSVASAGDHTGDITLYPNPVISGKCILDVSQLEFQRADISIWDLLGRKIYGKSIGGEVKTLPLSVQELSSGIYILEVSGKDFTKHIQFSVVK